MLINLRNALMAGKRLPYDAEVEFLESTGTQYIDVDASKVATASRYVCYGQYMVSSNQAMMWSHGYRGIRSYGGYIGFVTGKYATTNTTVIYDTGCIIDFDAVSLKGILTSPSGTELANVTIGSSSASGGLRIFAASETATGYLASQSRLYFIRVYDAAGNILFDYIPVRKGTVGYLYDRVSGKLFGNAGTGDFVLGPDVVPVEYIESHGTEWIDTGIKPSPSTSVETVFAMTTFTANCGLFGARGAAVADSKSYNLFIINNSGARVRWDWSGSGQYQTSEADTSTDATYVLGAAGGNITRNGTTVMSVSASKAAINYPLYVFNFNNVGTPYSTGANARFWSVKIYDGQTLGNNFLPVRVGTEGAMMDTLTRRIYRNAGTGAFGYGNDLKYPIPAE